MPEGHQGTCATASLAVSVDEQAFLRGFSLMLTGGTKGVFEL